MPDGTTTAGQAGILRALERLESMHTAARAAVLARFTSQDGRRPTALWNLLPGCLFHHLIVIHRWGWKLTLNPDGTTTAISPQGRTIHSHSPPPHGHSPPPHGHCPPGGACGSGNL